MFFSIFWHYLGIIITGRNKKTFTPAQTEITLIEDSMGNVWADAPVWLMISFHFEYDLWGYLGRYWNLSIQDAHFRVYFHHYLLLWYFKCYYVKASQFVIWLIMCPLCVTDFNIKFPLLSTKPKETLRHIIESIYQILYYYSEVNTGWWPMCVMPSSVHKILMNHKKTFIG